MYFFIYLLLLKILEMRDYMDMLWYCQKVMKIFLKGIVIYLFKYDIREEGKSLKDMNVHVIIQSIQIQFIKYYPIQLMDRFSILK